MDLITIEEANDHLLLDLEGDGGSPEDFSDDERFPEVDLLIGSATGAVLDYISAYVAREEPSWDPESVPRPIKVAVLMVLAWLWEHRGDDEAEAEGYMNAPVKALLHRYRDLVCA